MSDLPATITTGPRTLFDRQALRADMLERGIRLPENVEYGKGGRALLWTMPEAWEAVRTSGRYNERP